MHLNQEDPGRVVRPEATSYQYDAVNNLTSVAQCGSHNRSFIYDSLSRLVCASNPENGLD